MESIREMKYNTAPDEKDRITCLLCRHSCKLKEGQVGFCGVNRNTHGELDNMVYGHPVAINLDPIEKKPLNHVLPGSTAFSFGTVGCNFKCPFCQNWNISQEHEINENIKVSPQEMVDMAIEAGAKSIAYTYNEPTIFYPYAKDIGKIAKSKGLKNLFVSNGFETPEIIEDMAAWVDAANIDLKSWDEGYYKRVLKGGLGEVKDTIERMIKAGIWVEVTTLLIEGENDSDSEIKEMAEYIANKLGKHIPWHLSAFHPDYKMLDHVSTRLKTLERAKRIGEEAGLHYIYLGNVPVHADTHCPGCGKLVIERSAYSVVANRLEDGRCPRCKRETEGIWEKEREFSEN